MNPNDIRHDPSINPRSEMQQRHKELLWMLRRWNLVKGQGCPSHLFREEVYQELAQQGWVERDDEYVYIKNKGLERGDEYVYITNKGLEDVKKAEEPNPTLSVVAENTTSQVQNVYDERVLPGATTKIDQAQDNLHAEKLVNQWQARLGQRFKVRVKE